jgi:hypothetical protein
MATVTYLNPFNQNETVVLTFSKSAESTFLNCQRACKLGELPLRISIVGQWQNSALRPFTGAF